MLLHHLQFASGFENELALHAVSVCSEDFRQAAILSRSVAEQLYNDAGGAVVGAFVLVAVGVAVVGATVVGATVGVAVVGAAVVGATVVGAKVGGAVVGAMVGGSVALHVNGFGVLPRPLWY
jgi:hypothetical protein